MGTGRTRVLRITGSTWAETVVSTNYSSEASEVNIALYGLLRFLVKEGRNIRPLQLVHIELNSRVVIKPNKQHYYYKFNIILL